jgi:ABC-type lipoprotein release transport system permease subunit
MDLAVIVSVAVILFLTAMFASYFPAYRAASIDPMQALRTD